MFTLSQALTLTLTTTLKLVAGASSNAFGHISDSYQ